jgi:hypothetical protein
MRVKFIFSTSFQFAGYTFEDDDFFHDDEIELPKILTIDEWFDKPR